MIFINTLINIYISADKKFVSNALNDWGGLQNVLSSTFLFIFLAKLRLENTPRPIAFCISKVSEYSLATYLLSYIGDKTVYNYAQKMGYASLDKFGYFILSVLCVFIISMFLSTVLNFIYSIICRLCYIFNHMFRN